MAEHQLPKLTVRVRFSSPAPAISPGRSVLTATPATPAALDRRGFGVQHRPGQVVGGQGPVRQQGSGSPSGVPARDKGLSSWGAAAQAVGRSRGPSMPSASQWAAHIGTSSAGNVPSANQAATSVGVGVGASGWSTGYVTPRVCRRGTPHLHQDRHRMPDQPDLVACGRSSTTGSELAFRSVHSRRTEPADAPLNGTYRTQGPRSTAVRRSHWSASLSSARQCSEE